MLGTSLSIGTLGLMAAARPLLAYMCCEALRKAELYWGAESSGPWGATWLRTIMTGRFGYARFDERK